MELLSNEMGLGKPLIILALWAVMHQLQASAQGHPLTDSKLFKVDRSGVYLENKVRSGAFWILASSNCLHVWACDWVRLFGENNTLFTDPDRSGNRSW